MDYALRGSDLPYFHVKPTKASLHAQSAGREGCGEAGRSLPGAVVGALLDALTRSASPTSKCRLRRTACGRR